MYLRLMSRLTLFFMCCFLFLIERGIAQQKQNDFTKRLFGVDGKMSAKSKSLFRNARTSTLSSKRIRVEDWPRYYSSYGSKKFPAYTSNTISNRRVNSKILPTELPLQDNLAEENQERALGGSLGKSAPALSAVQFRDAYYEKLDRRVDDWMDKVNNLSLRDINRFQFRKGRSAQPGFPVQRAGSKTNSPASPTPSRISDSTFVEGQLDQTTPKLPSLYRMNSKSIEGGAVPSRDLPKHLLPQPDPRVGRPISEIMPRLGPKNIRVQVK